MRQTNSILSTYSADTSGVCSALYEMGGMCIMHDASGCNSTYHTHDEPRWYDMDSLVYISALDDDEAMMGDESRVINDICKAAQELSPRFVAIAGTPIPMMMGTDFKGLAKEIESRIGIPVFGFPTNGMHSYISGGGAAMARVAGFFCPPAEECCRNKNGSLSVNVLGVTPLDFSITGNAGAISNYFALRGVKVCSVWAMGCDWEALMNVGRADVNLVVSALGLPLARVLKGKYGTPFVTGIPVGEKYSRKLLSVLENAAENKKSREICALNYPSSHVGRKTYIIGEAVWGCSMKNALAAECGARNVHVLCQLEDSESVMSEGDAFAPFEDDIFEALRDADIVIADPMFKPALRGRAADFIPFPHEGCSGRTYRKEIPLYIGEAFGCWLEENKKYLLEKV